MSEPVAAIREKVPTSRQQALEQAVHSGNEVIALHRDHLASLPHVPWLRPANRKSIAALLAFSDKMVARVSTLRELNKKRVIDLFFGVPLVGFVVAYGSSASQALWISGLLFVCLYVFGNKARHFHRGFIEPVRKWFHEVLLKLGHVSGFNEYDESTWGNWLKHFLKPARVTPEQLQAWRAQPEIEPILKAIASSEFPVLTEQDVYNIKCLSLAQAREAEGEAIWPG